MTTTPSDNHEHARNLIEEKIAAGQLIRLDNGSLIEAVTTVEAMRETVRAVVTAAVEDNLHLAAQLAWPLLGNRQIAGNAILMLAGLLDDALMNHAGQDRKTAAQLWQAAAEVQVEAETQAALDTERGGW